MWVTRDYGLQKGVSTIDLMTDLLVCFMNEIFWWSFCQIIDYEKKAKTIIFNKANNQEKCEDMKAIKRMTEERKRQKGKQWSTIIFFIKDRATQTPLNTGGDIRCSGRVRSWCSTSGTRHVNHTTKPVISGEWRKEQIVITINVTLTSNHSTEKRPHHMAFNKHKYFKAVIRTTTFPSNCNTDIEKR